MRHFVYEMKNLIYLEGAEHLEDSPGLQRKTYCHLSQLLAIQQALGWCIINIT